MLSNIVIKKNEELHKIYNNYLAYKGRTKSKIETELEKIKNKLTKEEYQQILEAAKDYENYIINIFANTRKIRVKFEDEDNLLKLDNLLDIEDL